ncbi:hypothetical protein FRB96_009227 [Tulasnella sp. 330]|nr:hypothetical protein FRB96_009227 [Tulasnella sp. 330]KAG8873520.1 hypothetical protein FRB97_006663 [Tulasnella sp. 331]KAG8881389.1 hypothetical protein FRB98_004369 [Tulasnella sp. 332]
MGLLHRLSMTFQKQESAEDYERVLASLAISIQSKQTRLSEIRLRERRATLLVTLYAIGAWLIYLAAWWTVLPRYHIWKPRSRDEVTLQTIIKAIPAIVGPVLILFIRRIVQSWYTRKAEWEEKQLKSLMAEQRTKIDEIKKKTNYYTTKNLLDRYDEPAAKKTPAPNTPESNLRQRRVPGSVASPQGPGAYKSPQGTPARLPALQVVPPGSASQIQARQQILQHTIPQPMAPPRKQWYDKVADAILGDDEASSGSQHTRYALICDSCFAHNGLVRESEYDDMKYLCPKCGFFNASPRMKRENPTPLNTAVPQFTAQKSPLGRRADGSISPPMTSPGVDSPSKRFIDVPRSSSLNVEQLSSSLRNEIPRGRKEANSSPEAGANGDADGDESMARMDVDAQ